MDNNNHISANSFDSLPEDFTFGVELEFSGGMTVDQTVEVLNYLKSINLIDEGWTVHYDNSIVDENGLGAEIVSPPLRDNEQTKREIDIITKVIKSYGGVMNDKTGGHIHFGLQCLGDNVNDIKNFLKLYLIFEPLLYKLSTGDLDSVRCGCREYAIPLQNRLVNVVDRDAKSLLELVSVLMCNVGANPTHYGENRYYGLNIQRLVEGLRNIPDDMSFDVALEKLFNGEELIGKDGKKISPTIEFRFRNGSSDSDEIISAARMLGGMMVSAKNMNEDTKALVQSMYRNAKQRKPVAFGVVTRANREDPRYEGLSDEEILDLKFINSIYGNGKLDYNTFKVFMKIINPNLSEFEIKKNFNIIKDKLKPTKFVKDEYTLVNEDDHSYSLAMAA